MQVSRKRTSWVLIVACLLLIWPLGLVLLVKRLAVDRGATMTCGKPLTLIAYLLTGFGVLYLILSLYQGSGLSVHAGLLVAGGVWLIILANKMIATGNRYRRYIDLIINKSQTSIEYIASVVGVPYMQALDDIKRMVDLGYFPGAFVSVPAKEIRLSGASPVFGFQTAYTAMASPETPPEAPPRVVLCRNCGANNKVPAWQTAECEYCGSPVR